MEGCALLISNPLQNTFQVEQNLGVPDALNLIALGIQKSCPSQISLGIDPLPIIHLDDQALCFAEKVDNDGANRHLASKSQPCQLPISQSP